MIKVMRKKMWSAGVIIGIMISSSVGHVSSAEAPQPLPPVQTQPAIVVQPAAALLERIAEINEFADWRGATVEFIRHLHAPTGEKNARLWHVSRQAQELGYLITTEDGQHLYEISRRHLPDVPQELQSKLLPDGYIYSGPMMHLAYVRGSEGLELYNLFTGEIMPAGELLNLVPALYETGDAVKPQGNAAVTERHLPSSTTPADDALYATGRYGTSQIKQTEGVLSLRTFVTESASQNTSQQAFVVYDVIPNKLFVSLMMSKIVQQGNLTYIGLQDPFASANGEPDQPLVYIDSRFDVPVILPDTPSAQ